jgi:hypothetical protein
MDYFDYENAAREAGISEDRLVRIVATMKREFPHDPMMCELHVLRACMAVRDGQITADQVLATSATAKP